MRRRSALNDQIGSIIKKRTVIVIDARAIGDDQSG
jgi:hypothetical protein